MEDESGDLNNFGYQEIEEAKRLLDAFAYNNNTEVLGTGVTLHFNANSGTVYLVDEDYNAAVLTSEGILEDWFTCGECGFEGFKDDLIAEGNECCKELLINLEILHENEDKEVCEDATT